MNVKQYCTPGVVYSEFTAVHAVHMGKKTVKKAAPIQRRHTFQPTKIRQWREHRKLTQEQLADKVGEYLSARGLAEGYSYATIGRLETGKIKYQQHVMEAIAFALDTDVPSLIVRDPAEAETLMGLIDRASPDQRRTFTDMIKGAVRIGTRD